MIENKLKKMIIIIMSAICFMFGFKMMQMNSFWGAVMFDMLGTIILWVFMELDNGRRKVYLQEGDLPEDLKEKLLETLKKLELEDCGNPECEVHGTKKVD